nr:MAG TPA: hypothetical protein [Caudoviricetes sp.]
MCSTVLFCFAICLFAYNVYFSMFIYCFYLFLYYFLYLKSLLFTCLMSSLCRFRGRQCIKLYIFIITYGNYK